MRYYVLNDQDNDLIARYIGSEEVPRYVISIVGTL